MVRHDFILIAAAVATTAGAAAHAPERRATQPIIVAQMGQGGHAMGEGQKAYKLGNIVVEQPWARASLGVARTGAAYLAIRNAGPQPDRLIGVSADVAARVEIHNHINDGGIMRMRRVDGVDVPAGGMAMLQPGGYHVMFMGLRAPFKAGESFPLTVEFEKAGKVRVMVQIRAMGGPGGGHHMH